MKIRWERRTLIVATGRVGVRVLLGWFKLGKRSSYDVEVQRDGKWESARYTTLRLGIAQVKITRIWHHSRMAAGFSAALTPPAPTEGTRHAD